MIVFPSLLFFLAVCAVVIGLQIFLSKNGNKWAGLILPGVSFLISLSALLGIMFFTPVIAQEVIMQNGVVVGARGFQLTPPSSVVASGIYAFLLYNIPTGVLLAIYAACRGKQNKRRALEKMSAQDL